MNWARFAQQMASLARDLLAQTSVDATLQRITDSAVELVEGCDAAGILVLHGTRTQTPAPTEKLVVGGHTRSGAPLPRRSTPDRRTEPARPTAPAEAVGFEPTVTSLARDRSGHRLAGLPARSRRADRDPAEATGPEVALDQTAQAYGEGAGGL
jgi:hypothetical protein